MASTKTQKSMNSNEQDRHADGIEISGQERATFASILAIVDLDAISKFASTVRQSGHLSTAGNLTRIVASLGFTPCKVNSAPFSGSYNIVFAIEFTDGVCWMLKIPANGHNQQFGELASKALISEARTMQMIKKATTIPIPAVYAFDGSLDNELHVPFILMERIDGTPLYKGWFNEDEKSKAQLEKFRARALQSLAAAMAQLNLFMLDHGGSVVFDSDGKAVGVGGAKIVDANAMWYSEDENPNNIDIFCEKGPFANPKPALRFMLDRRPSRPEDDAYLKGVDALLRMFVEWACEKKPHGPRFVLAHPDFDIQNILVAEDGTLRGLIDWDGVAAVPREVGCAQFPIWLMHDWIETQYDYDISAGKPREEAGYNESSPNELSCYRAMYAQFMEQEIALNTKGSAHLTVHGTTPKEEADVTRRSLVMKNLEIATNTPMVTSDIVDHMLALIVDLTKLDWEDVQPDCDSSFSTQNEIETEMIERKLGSATVEYVSGSSGSGSESNICSNSDKDSTDTKVTEIDDEDQAMVANDSTNHFDDKAVNMDAFVTEPPLLSEVEAREQGTEPSADTCGDKPGSTSLGWTWRLLRLGCDKAEICLRSIAKIGHVQNDAVGRVAEVPAKVEAQHGKVAMQGEFEQIKGISSTQGMEASRQTTNIALIIPTAEVDESSARNADLLKPAKAEKKVTEYTKEKAETEEQEIWERIAIDVRNCGVPVEILRKHEFQITSCVIGTIINELKAEQKQDQDLTAYVTLAEEAISVATETASSSTADAEPDSSAGMLALGRHATLINKEVAIPTTQVTRVPSSSSFPSTSGYKVLMEKIASRLRAWSRCGTSYLKCMFASPIASGCMRHLTSDSTDHSEEDEEDEVQSDDRGTPSFSLMFLNDDEVEVGEKEDDGEVVEETSALSVNTLAEDGRGGGERHEGEPDVGEDDEGESNKNEVKEDRMSKATGKTKDRHDSVHTEGSDQERGLLESFAHRKVYDLCSVEWVEAFQVDKGTKSRTTPAIREGVEDLEPAETHVAGGDNKSEAGDESGAEDDKDGDQDNESSSDEDEDASRQQVAFVDRGRFDTWTILNVLGLGDLDELRMLRLREGFFKLLEQC